MKITQRHFYGLLFVFAFTLTLTLSLAREAWAGPSVCCSAYDATRHHWINGEWKQSSSGGYCDCIGSLVCPTNCGPEM